MAMGMDYAWHRGRAESTGTGTGAPPVDVRATGGPESRETHSAGRWRALYVQANRRWKSSVASGVALANVVDLLTDDVENLRSAFNLSRATVEQQRLAIGSLRERVKCLAGDLTQAQIINAGHASWRRDAEAEYESVRQKLDSHYLLPHLSAIDMAAALAKVRPVGGPPFDLVEGVRQVVHDLLLLREWKARARERSLEVEGLRAERDEATCIKMARLRDRLEATIADTIEEWVESEEEEGVMVGAQCTACQREADAPDAIRHVAGTRIGERACPYLLTMRALGRPVLDDSEGVA